MNYDSELFQHREWLGLLQPEGLVVSPPALAAAQAFVDKPKALTLQPKLQNIAQQGRLKEKEQTWIANFSIFAEQILEWEPEDYVEQGSLPEQLVVDLTNYGETLRPDYGVEDPDSEGWLLLVQTVPLGHDFDKQDPAAENGWKATYQQKFERLLKGVQVPIGLLWNGVQMRLVYAPSGESSGHLTFPISAMTEVPGRLILGALEMLVGADRLFNAPTAKTLPKLLEASRNYQAEVSNKLAEQVLDALWELLRGFQAAESQREGQRNGKHQDSSFRELAEKNPQHVYGGLLTTLMRLVFLLYAEDQGLMPDDAVYQSNYSVSGLYEKLRTDAGCYPDTMDQRYGAWAWLLSLFRLVYDGGGAYEAYLPARHGQLFDPEEYPFLQGSPLVLLEEFGLKSDRNIPRIADGVIYRMLEKLLILNGERLSYRALDVEQIGSVYEAIMGYEVEIAPARSIALKPKDVVINLEALLVEKPQSRAKFLQNEAELKLTGNAAKALKAAETVEDVLAALDRRVSKRTMQVLMPGALYLQPGEERRRTGSHYTPRKLTQPIVETTLRPIFEQLGEHPTAEQILDLKVCDLAMGSAAFLVEACRQLAAKLVDAWDYHGIPGDVPEAMEPLLYARRLVAQRCLYGVDKNPFAVNLAKLSLWLVTLARDLPFTFVDHALKCGDSLVGLTRQEIVAFGRDPIQDLPLMEYAREQLLAATVLRGQIQVGDTLSDGDAALKYQQWQDAETKLLQVRMQGDVAVAAFFNSCGKSKKDREALAREYGAVVREQPERVMEIARGLREREKPVVPFNWEVEFPEVFGREDPGFDAIVGNPPFIGGSKISSSLGTEFLAYILKSHPESHGNGDLVAHFFRKAFNLLRPGGALGLIATNTIAQGDTRFTGLRWICNQNGSIYEAYRRVRWPGLAAVVVSVVHVAKGEISSIPILNGVQVNKISAFLFHSGGDENPQKLLSQPYIASKGCNVSGSGFFFDDRDSDCHSVSVMHDLIMEEPEAQNYIYPYIGGDEVNTHPSHTPSRYIVNINNLSSLDKFCCPLLLKLVESKVKDKRLSGRLKNIPWWRYERPRPSLYEAIKSLGKVLVCSQTSKYRALTFMDSRVMFDQKLIVFALEEYQALSLLQSRIHEVWSIFFGSTMKDDPVYTSSDCFETFPFPANWETDPTLEAIGQTYYQFRADLMVHNNQGLTDTYNRFHAPQETDPEILKLRDLHSQMDRAVLNAYDWPDIDTTCGFALDYLDIDENNLPPAAQDRLASGNLYFPTATEAVDFDNLIQSSCKTRKKLPWRYRWPETTHDEVLARLLDLNQQRYDDEVKAGLHNKKKTKKKKAKKSSTSSKITKNSDKKPVQPEEEQLNLL